MQSKANVRCISLEKDTQSHHYRLLRQVVVNELGGDWAVSDVCRDDDSPATCQQPSPAR